MTPIRMSYTVLIYTFNSNWRKLIPIFNQISTICVRVWSFILKIGQVLFRSVYLQRTSKATCVKICVYLVKLHNVFVCFEDFRQIKKLWSINKTILLSITRRNLLSRCFYCSSAVCLISVGYLLFLLGISCFGAKIWCGVKYLWHFIDHLQSTLSSVYRLILNRTGSQRAYR